MPGGTKGVPQDPGIAGSLRSSLRQAAPARLHGVGGAVLPAAVESLATMSTSKLPGPARPADATPAVPATRSVRLPSVSRPGEPTAIMQEKVLAEIAHELGNFFHKLYYWSDYLKEGPARKTADITAAQMLESTIKNLEGFLKASLDYFQPTQLAPSRMRVTDLIEGLLFQLGAHLNGTPVSVADGRPWHDAVVSIDPGQLSRALEVAVRHLTKEVGAGSALYVVVDRARRRDAEGVEVAFRIREPNEASPLFRTAEAGVEWAVAQKVIALHGGELHEVTEGRHGKTMVFFLPLAPEAIEV
jgi:signal transduction histidine kinase